MISSDAAANNQENLWADCQSPCSAYYQQLAERRAENPFADLPDQPFADRPSDSSVELDESDSSAKSSSQDADCEMDYACLDQTPVEPYAFDPEVAYREGVRSVDGHEDSFDLLLDLQFGICSSSIAWPELKRIIESTARIYDKLNGKLKKTKSRMCGQSNQISALKRVVLCMQFHQKKLNRLGQNVSGKIACYRKALESNSYDPFAERIQLLTDLIYNPSHEFSALVHRLNLPADDGLVDAGHIQLLTNLRSNLERLCLIDKELKSIKSLVKLSLEKRDRLIDQLRPAIVRDVLNIYNRLLTEEYDSSSVIGGYRQECTARSFYKLLTTIY